MPAIVHTYQRYIGALNYALFMLLMFLLPFPWHFVQPVTVIWLIAWVLEGRWLQRSNFRLSKGLIPMLLLVLFVGWEALSLLWSLNPKQGAQDLTMHLPVLAMALIGLFGVNDNYKAINIKQALIIGCLVAVACYLMTIYWYYSIGHLRRDTQYFWWSCLGDGLIGKIKHRFYLAMCLMLSLAFSVDVFKHYRDKYNPVAAALTIAVVDMILVASIILTGSRIMMLLLPIMAILLFFQHYKGKYKRIFAVAVIIASVLFVGLCMRYQTRFVLTIERLKTNYEVGQSINNRHIEPRIYIWHKVLDNAKQYGICGLGMGSATDLLVAEYEKDGITDYAAKRWGTHNQYLNTWMDLGPLAVLLMVLILFSSVYCHTGQARRDATVVCLLFGVGLMMETALLRMSGLYIFYALLTLLLLEQRAEEQVPLVRR